jgi:hypothetical protein
MWDGINPSLAGMEDRPPDVQAAIHDSSASVWQDLPSPDSLWTSYLQPSRCACHPVYGWPGSLSVAGTEFLAYPPVGINNSTIVGISHTGNAACRGQQWRGN